MSVHKVTLLSQANNTAEFITTLPAQVTIPTKKWQLNIDSIGFRAVFSNVKHLEEYGPHIIAWNCQNFLQSHPMFDRRKPETFPSYTEISEKYFILEERLDDSKRLGDMEMLASMMNGLLKWDEFLFEDQDEEKGVVYSVGNNGLKIKGNGKVVLLLSPVLARWIGLSESGVKVKFGTHRNAYYRFFDFSDGTAYSVEGTIKDVLTSHNAEPSRISVMASFNYQDSKEKCLAIIPYDKSSISSSRLGGSTDINNEDDDDTISICHNNQRTEQYYHRELSTKETVYIDVGIDVRQVKIRLIDQHGRKLRLIGNKYLPTVVSLTFKEIVSTMPKSFVCRVSGYSSDLMTYLDPPLQNTRGKWQVALQSVYIPTTIDWVEDKDRYTQIKFVWTRLNDAGKKEEIAAKVADPLPSSVFRSPKALVHYLKAYIEQETLGKAFMTELRGGRIQFRLQDGIEIHMYRKLAAVLGLDNVVSSHGMVFITETVTATTVVDVTRVVPATISIHCSMVRPSVLGNAVTDLLLTVPTNKRSGSEGELIVYEPRKPMFYDIKSDHIANFVISLKDLHSRRPIKFYEAAKGVENEKVLANLMFRERKK